MDSKEIGKKLKESRADKTVEEVANAVGISKSALGMYEAGERKTGSLDKPPADSASLSILDLI